MKKLLTLLGSVALIATTSAAVIACGGTRSEQRTEDKNEKNSFNSKSKKRGFRLIKSNFIRYFRCVIWKSYWN
ncbi:hypothetical protein FOY66_02315 [Mycoplasma capricolum subsp. capripneumoniae]|uniref:lipoprotein n=1 Tax=Mycoplasma capricolum TaxID=2095 RepID=UPI000AF417C9|nr:lipoprotein [Mycoplasma capricolum]QDL19609.1 hypothetical protein DQW15_02330 [Mycoplasma capricolum subsp. capripneumoniae]QDL20294.1 hypothetical protein DQW16_02330 [Mycoplasma capricolum subsp. capripneumoniae]QDL20981.1 hypothetical protein DQW17_02330 [Mycoplasma capricolum subsp. capripneumoniae]QIF40248.1 hypothetical protein MCCP002_02315 [Mycoplasma capricolum subsp. capripneumoniae]QIN42384.1 hypothetical protein FOY62_02310 [Mycoplasma capricolum subsp. capripneumoniae]